MPRGSDRTSRLTRCARRLASAACESRRYGARAASTARSCCASAPTPPLRRRRRDAIGVENAVDVAQAADRPVERLRVGHLDDEAIADHLVGHGAARLEDVDPGL